MTQDGRHDAPFQITLIAVLVFGSSWRQPANPCIGAKGAPSPRHSGWGEQGRPAQTVPDLIPPIMEPRTSGTQQSASSQASRANRKPRVKRSKPETHIVGLRPPTAALRVGHRRYRQDVTPEEQADGAGGNPAHVDDARRGSHHARAETTAPKVTKPTRNIPLTGRNRRTGRLSALRNTRPPTGLGGSRGGLQGLQRPVTLSVYPDEPGDSFRFGDGEARRQERPGR